MEILINNRRGFTLIELMVVIGIIAILATFALPEYKKFTAKSKQTEVKTIFNQIHKQYLMGYRSYETPFEGAFINMWGFGGGFWGGCIENGDNYHAPSLLGISFDQCEDLRYRYQAFSYWSGTAGLYAHAISLKLFGDCEFSDRWVMDGNQNMVQITDGINNCI